MSDTLNDIKLERRPLATIELKANLSFGLVRRLIKTMQDGEFEHAVSEYYIHGYLDALDDLLDLLKKVEENR